MTTNELNQAARALLAEMRALREMAHRHGLIVNARDSARMTDFQSALDSMETR